jgi:hypothetical protein
MIILVVVAGAKGTKALRALGWRRCQNGTWSSRISLVVTGLTSLIVVSVSAASCTGGFGFA